MSEKITIRYTTSDKRIIVLSESDSTPESAIKMSSLQKIKFVIEAATFLAIIATLGIYVVLAILQFKANSIYKKQATISLDSEERQLRAYLHVTPSIFQLGKVNPTKMTCDVINDGETPASRVTISAVFVVVPYPIILDANIKPGEEIEQNRFYLAPHCTNQFDVVFNGTLSNDQIVGLQNDTERFYCIGDMAYHDTFNIERHMKFGYIIEAKDMDWGNYGKAPTKSVSAKYEYMSNRNYEY